jgi:hypothetical protein
MSKPSKPKPALEKTATSVAPITADSPATAIMAEKIRIQLELLRRQAYQDVLVLRARLAELPPVPEDHEPKA